MSYGLKINHCDLFEVTFRDHNGELLVGFAPSEEEAQDMIVTREMRLYLEEKEREGKPLPSFDEARHDMNERLHARMALYAIIRASG